jgi:hypothetical protein
MRGSGRKLRPLWRFPLAQVFGAFFFVRAFLVAIARCSFLADAWGSASFDHTDTQCTHPHTLVHVCIAHTNHTSSLSLPTDRLSRARCTSIARALSPLLTAFQSLRDRLHSVVCFYYYLRHHVVRRQARCPSHHSGGKHFCRKNHSCQGRRRSELCVCVFPRSFWFGFFFSFYILLVLILLLLLLFSLYSFPVVSW